MRGARVDIEALRQSRPFRRLFFGHMLSGVGNEITTVAIMYQVYVLSGESELAVGFVGLVRVVPTIVASLLAGAIADAVDRRLLLVSVQVGSALTAVTLALLALGEPPLPLLYALVALSAVLLSLDGPTRTAIIPSLVPDELLRSAVQLREMLTQISRTFGPVIGGLLIAKYGLAAAYAVDAASFALAFVTYLGLPTLIPHAPRRFELSSITEGLSYVRRQPILASTFAADLIAMILGMPRAVFPAFALTVYDVGPAGLGYLTAAPAAGALVGVFISGWTSHVKREGRAVLIAVSIWGAAIALFGLSHSLALALVLLAIAGAADMVSAIFRQTILLATVPDELRGRMSSLHIMVVTGGPPLGDFEAGAAAELIGLRPSVVVGGVGCIVGCAALAAKVPEFARWVDPRRTSAPPIVTSPPASR